MSSKNLMALWSEFNPDSTRSLVKDFKVEADPRSIQILDYLNHGEVTMISLMESFDVFTGEVIVKTRCMRTDGEFSWMNTLSYYVEKYNLQLPEEFVKRAIEGRPPEKSVGA